uniref:NTR domain-containing protein n=1 Tax=Rhabditophanes sp. KR3021 TaxID=114890 RepID=A0AC35U178_9BILA
MFRVVLCWFILVVLIGGIYGVCDCKPKTAKEAFCNADWVSHLKIVKKNLVNTTDDETGLPSGAQLSYSVKHIDVFKKPATIKKLSDNVGTRISSAACGLDYLQEGHEYLLSGSVDEKGKLFVGSCGQIQSDSTNSSAGFPQQWIKMTKTQKVKLLSGGYGKNCTAIAE